MSSSGGSASSPCSPWGIVPDGPDAWAWAVRGGGKPSGISVDKTGSAKMVAQDCQTLRGDHLRTCGLVLVNAIVCGVAGHDLKCCFVAVEHDSQLQFVLRDQVGIGVDEVALAVVHIGVDVLQLGRGSLAV